MYLQQFDFSVVHKAGKHHTNADTLSWIPPADVVMSLTHSLLGNSPVDIRAAQQADKQLSPVITAVSSISKSNGVKYCKSELLFEVNSSIGNR